MENFLVVPPMKIIYDDDNYAFAQIPLNEEVEQIFLETTRPKKQFNPIYSHIVGRYTYYTNLDKIVTPDLDLIIVKFDNNSNRIVGQKFRSNQPQRTIGRQINHENIVKIYNEVGFRRISNTKITKKK